MILKNKVQRLKLGYKLAFRSLALSAAAVAVAWAAAVFDSLVFVSMLLSWLEYTVRSLYSTKRS